MNEYDASKINWVKWPETKQVDDETWIRVWDVVLVNEVKDEESIAKFETELSNEEITITVEAQGKNLEVTVNTLRWSLDDDLIVYNFKILQGINDIIGEIEIIQGDVRDAWLPFSQQKRKSND